MSPPDGWRKPGEAFSEFATQDLSDVDRWLSDEDDKETSKLKSEPETRQFRLDDTSHSGIVATGEVPVDPNQETKVEESKKKEPGKLPPPFCRYGKQFSGSRRRHAEKAVQPPVVRIGFLGVLGLFPAFQFSRQMRNNVFSRQETVTAGETEKYQSGDKSPLSQREMSRMKVSAYLTKLPPILQRFTTGR